MAKSQERRSLLLETEGSNDSFMWFCFSGVQVDKSDNISKRF